MNALAGVDMAALHLLRPQWLWALLALPLLAWLWKLRRRRASAWRGAVDAHLLPHLLAQRADVRTRWTSGLAALAYTIAVVALAGPSWRQTPQPLWQSRAPLVIALDLSSAATAADVPPSRLAQSRAKISTLLRERAAGQVALVAYAGDAFTVAPLTEDVANVALFLDALAPDVMPVDGQRADRAIDWSVQLLRRAGFDRGDIVVLTAQSDDAARDAAARAARQGYRVFALGIGTAAGAPYRRSDGSFGQARLDAASLRAMAAAGDGGYAGIAAGDDDLGKLGILDPGQEDAGVAKGRARAWQDQGYWLLPPLMLLALLAFRRRAAMLVLALCFAWPIPQARAAELWRRADQVEHAHMEEASQAYRRGDFPQAATLFGGADSADAHYNRGNALAKAGQYPQAIAAYDEALKRRPGMDDAMANKRAVEAAMKRQSSKSKDESNSGQPQRRQTSPGSQSSQAGTGQPPPKPGKPQQDRQPAQQQQAAKPADAQAQRQADAAQRERMQRALQQQQRNGQAEPRRRAEQANETPQQREQRLANEAWLRRVPDDPGSLLREKFRIEQERRLTEGQGQP
ncbi:tetratricopeptide repeat protein [Lysobacter sp. S4-A87]|uniref:tetratricopeptide repeat protein n=1 Tax=Lysobacter sp. S4-A87 TaxID=2925843 RepID=UPI001F53DB65|nr:tetratricopeptide repeat protein [Lysobacter sp. S4-A87]UNK50902.1 tetratricopeptide repeat protein [Lysobacter sp. S4-A87]